MRDRLQLCIRTTFDPRTNVLGGVGRCFRHTLLEEVGLLTALCAADLVLAQTLLAVDHPGGVVLC